MKYFTEKELGIEDANAIVKANMKKLVEKVLDPLREKVGKIKINSGYRTPTHNKEVGGSPTSQHIKGQAVDLVPLDTDIDTVFTLLIREFKYDQVILEKKNSRWIHISYNEGHNRQKAMTAIVDKATGKATYKNV